MFKTIDNFGIPEISVQEVHELVKAGQPVHLVDVRRPEEYTGELGHVSGATLKTLGPELSGHLQTLDRTKPVIFICRSGARSGQATSESLQLGFTTVANMTGGMIKWNAEKLPTEV